MTDEQRNGGAPGTPGAWQPIAPGEYEVDATAFVELPEGVVDGYGTEASPLAAPGHGYVPPQITITPAAGGAADPAGTDVWGVTPGLAGEQHTGATQQGAVHWPDPNALPHQDAGQRPGEPGTGQHLQDPYGYDPGLTQMSQADGTGAGGTGGPWHFGDAQGAAHPGGHPDGSPGTQAGAPGTAGGAFDVTGQWSIPLAQGDLGDETGEFTTSVLAAQWGGVPPTTLPGGAAAPWATGAETGQPWETSHTEPQQAEHLHQVQRMQQGVRAQQAGRVEQEYQPQFQDETQQQAAAQSFPAPGTDQHPGGQQVQDMPVDQGQGPQQLRQYQDQQYGNQQYEGGQYEGHQPQDERLHGQQFHEQGLQGGPVQDLRDPAQGRYHQVPGTSHETPSAAPLHTPYPLEADYPPGGQTANAAGPDVGYAQSGPGAGYVAPGTAADPGAPAPDGFRGAVDDGFQGQFPGTQAPFSGAPTTGGPQDLAGQSGAEAFAPDAAADDDAIYVRPAAPEAALLPDAELRPGQAAPRAPQSSRPPRRPLQDTRVQEPLPEEVTGEHAPEEVTHSPAARSRDQADQGEHTAPETVSRAPEAFPQEGGQEPAAQADGAEPFAPAETPEGTLSAALSQESAPTAEHTSEPAPADPAPGTEDASGPPHSPDEPQDSSQGQASEDVAYQEPEDPQGAPHAQQPRAPQTSQVTVGRMASADRTAAAETRNAENAEISETSEDEEEDGSEPVHDEHPLGSYVLRVNGTDRPVTGAWIGESLLYVLRERLGLAGAKDGCSQGECGACNVQVDGRLVASCLVPAATTAGSEVRTVEGLAQGGQPSDVQRALAQCGAVQCGFCVPGMAMTVHDLLEGNPDPTDLEARQALAGNLCRCSGYRGVLDAVRSVIGERRASAEAEAKESAQPAGQLAADGGTEGRRIPHQTGPGASEAASSGGHAPFATRTTQAPYRDAASYDTSFDTYDTPYAKADTYEDDGYDDDGGRA